jgi:hypothetical protein
MPNKLLCAEEVTLAQLIVPVSGQAHSVVLL